MKREITKTLICVLIGISAIYGIGRLTMWLSASLDPTDGLNALSIEGPVLPQAVPAKISGYYKVFNVSAYDVCLKCCGKTDGVTASGYKIKKGDRLVAADRRYSFGTKMNIPGYNNGKTVKVLDRGGVIKGDKLDLLFDNHQEALKWGRKTVKIFVYNET